MADYFVFYLERDVLGKLANLHLAWCDQLGPEGPKDENSIFLSHLQSIAVDFAKHGECVSKENYGRYEQLIKEWPDFFEKTWTKMRPSEGILGKLYRDICENTSMVDLLENEYKNSIKLDYVLEPLIL